MNTELVKDMIEAMLIELKEKDNQAVLAADMAADAGNNLDALRYTNRAVAFNSARITVLGTYRDLLLKLNAEPAPKLPVHA